MLTKNKETPARKKLRARPSVFVWDLLYGKLHTVPSYQEKRHDIRRRRQLW